MTSLRCLLGLEVKLCPLITGSPHSHLTALPHNPIPLPMAKSSVLYAAAKEIGSACDAENRAFLACKQKNEDPEACLGAGGLVQDCGLGVLKSAMEKCGDALTSYAACLDRQISQEYMFDRCRAEEGDFATCRREKGGIVVAAKALEGKGAQPRKGRVKKEV